MILLLKKAFRAFSAVHLMAASINAPVRNLLAGGALSFGLLTILGCTSGDYSQPSPQARSVSDAGSEPVKTVSAGFVSPESAVADPKRFDADRKDDPLRKPAEVLSFINIPAGASILDIEAGTGYYSEMMASITGPEGRVVMQNPALFDQFIPPTAYEQRLGKNGERLPTVSLIKSDFDNIPLADSSVDIVTWFLGPHELYFVPAPGVSLGDVDTAYAEIVRVLKPGGIFVTIDHAADAGDPETTGNTTHRIDPAIIRDLAETAGLVFVEGSDLLINPDDDHTRYVLDPTIRRQTDRFLHKYRKPA